MSNKIVIRAQPHDRGLLLEVRASDTSAIHIPLAWGEPFTLHLAYESGEEVDLARVTEGPPA
jgi:hypothetical protein